MITNFSEYLQSINEGEIDYKREKAWKIKDQFPIEVTIKRAWHGGLQIVPPPMSISHDEFSKLGEDWAVYTGRNDWSEANKEHLRKNDTEMYKIAIEYPNRVHCGTYDMEDGSCYWTAEDETDIKNWLAAHSDKIVCNTPIPKR